LATSRRFESSYCLQLEGDFVVGRRATDVSKVFTAFIFRTFTEALKKQAVQTFEKSEILCDIAGDLSV
jgi:hypothetical protein